MIYLLKKNHSYIELREGKDLNANGDCFVQPGIRARPVLVGNQRKDLILDGNHDQSWENTMDNLLDMQ
jgi:hypothetical protein